MNIIYQLLFAVLITTVTSTLLLFVWRLLRGFFMRTDPKMIYTMLRFICITYLLPLGYVAVLFTYRKWLQGDLPIWKLVFVNTDIMKLLIFVAMVIWFARAYRESKKQYISKKNLLRFLEDNIPAVELESDTVNIFETVCSKLNIKQNEITLYINPLTNTPLIVDARSPKVILPEKDYTQEELELIFYHELSHYKHHDLIYKSVTLAISIIHCINPLMGNLKNCLEVWGECMADVSALELSGKLPYARQYYDKILAIVPCERNADSDKYFFSALYLNEQEIILQRINFMTHYQHSKIPSKLMTLFIAVLFIMISMLTAFVSGKAIAGVTNFVYCHTEEKINETVDLAVDIPIEYTCQEEELAMDGMSYVHTSNNEIENNEGSKILDWTVKANTRYICDIYKVNAGQCIQMYITTIPSDKKYLLGIMDESGDLRYINGDESLEHKFIITEDGNYSIFIQNTCVDETELSVKGCIFVAD